jgi:AcrR family transcriptional regulator
MDTLSKRQQEIVQASIDLIAERGIQELTIKNLSARIGVTEGAIYRHFRSKLDILLAILHLFRSSSTKMIVQMEALSGTALDKIESVFFRRLDYLSEHSSIAAVIFSEEIFQNDKRLADEVFAILTNNQQAITGFISDGQQSGQIRTDTPPEILSTIIIGALRMLVTRWRLSAFRFDLCDEGYAVWASLKAMIKK